MSTPSRASWIVRSFVVFSSLGSFACSSSPSSAPAPTTVQPDVAATTVPASTSPVSSSPPSTAAVSTPPGTGPQTFDASLVFGSGPFSMQTTTTGLAALSSYTATLTLSFEGTRGGQPSTWSKTYAMLANSAPAARQLTIQKSGDGADPAQVFMAEANGAGYEKTAEDACTATVIAPDATLAQRFEPAGLLAGVVGADAAGNEAINGVSSDHYTFDEHALGQSGRATATGEMWVASDGGYIVKYVLKTKGDANYFGEDIEGTLSWDYELTDIGQPVTITLPDDCLPGMLNVPQLPDASNVTNVPGLLTYQTATSLADIAAFYQAQMTPLGWTPGNDPTYTDTSMIEDFTQGTATLTVTASTDAGVTTVTIADTS
ncbi:MAG: hypothetical protein ACXV8L_04360 [Ilumatobacteraceae bacterium]